VTSRSRVVSSSSSVSSLRLDTPSRACFCGSDSKPRSRSVVHPRLGERGMAVLDGIVVLEDDPVRPCISSEQASPEEDAGLHAGCGRASRRCVRCVLTPMGPTRTTERVTWR
jgi:hypothetical protein